MEVQDPVCGMRFEAEEAASTVEYEEDTYYFCADACRQAFEEEPERFREQEK